MAKFKKGQKVYYASTNFGELVVRATGDSTRFCVIIERTVDACGAKQMTFENHGNDSVFGRVASASAYNYFATPEEALTYIEGYIANWAATRPDTIEILQGVFSDRDKECFKKFGQIKEERGFDKYGRK